MSEELADIAKKRGIKYFLVSFIDLFGVLRSKLVPAGRIHDIQRDGAGFAGFAAWFGFEPEVTTGLRTMIEADLGSLPST